MREINPLLERHAAGFTFDGTGQHDGLVLRDIDRVPQKADDIIDWIGHEDVTEVIGRRHVLDLLRRLHDVGLYLVDAVEIGDAHHLLVTAGPARTGEGKIGEVGAAEVGLRDILLDS